MTLTELYHIVKEEADMFESCLYKEQEEKRSKKNLFHLQKAMSLSGLRKEMFLKEDAKFTNRHF